MECSDYAGTIQAFEHAQIEMGRGLTGKLLNGHGAIYRHRSPSWTDIWMEV